jgi:oligopeptide transport system substrate-binding protein
MLYPIKGAEAYYTGAGSRDSVAVKALDDYTLQVDLARPSVYFPAYIAANNPYYAVPKHVVEKHGDVWVRPENVVFSGPFRITRYVPNSLIVLEPNPGWPLQRPSVSRIEYNVVPAAATALAMYEAGQLDFVMGLPFGEIGRIRNDPRLRDQFTVLPAFRIGTFNFNTKKAPWSNLKVRQAFMRAIDSEELTKGPFQGVLPSAYSLRPAQLPGGNLDYMRQLKNVDAAKALLAEAGYPDGRGFPEASIQVANEEDSKIAAEYLQQRFTRILGVRLNVRVMDTAAWLDAVQTGKGDSWISAVWSQCPDLFDLYNVVEGSASTNNMWKQAYVSQLLRQAAGESDIARRLRLYDQAEKHMVVENAVMVPLWVTDQTALVSNRVKNLKNDKRSFWIHTWEWIEVGP